MSTATLEAPIEFIHQIDNPICPRCRERIADDAVHYRVNDRTGIQLVTAICCGVAFQQHRGKISGQWVKCGNVTVITDPNEVRNIRREMENIRGEVQIADLDVLPDSEPIVRRVSRNGVLVNGKHYGGNDPIVAQFFAKAVQVVLIAGDVSRVSLYSTEGKFLCAASLNAQIPVVA